MRVDKTVVATAMAPIAAIPLLAGHEEPPLGAHLVTPRRGFIHHGIYVGSGRVVHAGGISGVFPGGPIAEVSLATFARGWAVSVRVAAPARFAAQEIVERARSRLGENRYRLLTNNCEHFCEWCLRGEARSHQADRLFDLLRRCKLTKTRDRRHAAA